MLMILAFLSVTGCDEGMNMAGPVITDPIVEPETNPATNGEVKQPDPGEQPDPPEKPEPTVAINTVIQADDGSITISGTSTELAAGETVTITLGDTVTITATTDNKGAWSVIVPATKTTGLAAGTTAVTAASGKATNTSSFEHAPPPEPTVTIESVTTEDDGSVTISGTSTELAAGETVTITLGDAVTATATTNSKGAWSVIVPATEAAGLAAGTVAVRATAKGIAEGESSFEHTPQPEQPGHGIVPATEAERIQLEIITSVLGYDDNTATEKQQEIFRRKYNGTISRYGSLFDVETDVGRATFQRFAEYDEKKRILASSGDFGNVALLNQYFEEAYGFSDDFAEWLVFEVYLPETEEDLPIPWQVHGIAMEYLLLQIANPDATEEELIELLRESIRAGNVSIAA